MKYLTFTKEAFLEQDEVIRVMRETVLHDHRLHDHEFIELAYIAQGKGVHCINGKEEPTSRGDLFLLGTHVVHGYVAEPDAPLLVYNYLFTPNMLDQQLMGGDFVHVAYRYLFREGSDSDGPRNYLKLTGIQFSKMEQLLLSLYVEYQGKEEGYKQVMKAQMLQLLVLMFRHYQKNDKQESDSILYKRLVAENAMTFLRENYATVVRVEQLAERYYVSESYFEKIFKEIAGTTVIAQLQKIRIEVACDLLKHTSLPVGEIASRVGYSDLKAFYRLFFREKEMTPGAFRAKGTESAHPEGTICPMQK